MSTENKILGTRYRVCETIGRGAAGTVYSAVDEQTEMAVALKIFDSEFVSSPGFDQRFETEVSSLKKLQEHPGIVRIIDFGAEDSTFWIATEFVEGAPLSKIIDSESWREKCRNSFAKWIGELCDALHFMHQNGIIHRDLKPENILIEKESNSVKICDFGISRLVKNTEYTRFFETTRVTNPDGLLGTFGYIPPEGFEDPTLLDEKSDIFSAGLVCYQLFHGRTKSGVVLVRPTRATTKAFEQILNDDPNARPATALDLKKKVLSLLNQKKRRGVLLSAGLCGTAIPALVFGAQYASKNIGNDDQENPEEQPPSPVSGTTPPEPPPPPELPPGHIAYGPRDIVSLSRDRLILSRILPGEKYSKQRELNFGPWAEGPESQNYFDEKNAAGFMPLHNEINGKVMRDIYIPDPGVDWNAFGSMSKANIYDRNRELVGQRCRLFNAVKNDVGNRTTYWGLWVGGTRSALVQVAMEKHGITPADYLYNVIEGGTDGKVIGSSFLFDDLLAKNGTRLGAFDPFQDDLLPIYIDPQEGYRLNVPRNEILYALHLVDSQQEFLELNEHKLSLEDSLVSCVHYRATDGKTYYWGVWVHQQNAKRVFEMMRAHGVEPTAIAVPDSAV